MTSCLLIILALQLGQSPGPAASAPDAPDVAQLADVQLAAAHLTALLNQLGDEKYETREAAQSQLMSLTDAQIAAGFQQITAVYRQTTDAEIRMRIGRFANDCFDRVVLPQYDQLHQPGFLGVTPTRAKLSDGTSAVVITSVLADSPALKVGLQNGDLITAVDDQPLLGTDPVGSFIKAVQQRHAGSRVRFTLHRGEQVQTVVAQLAALPNQYRDPNLAEFRKEQIELLRQRWWERGFLKGELHPQLPPLATEPPASDSRRPLIDQ